ncbi:MAG: helix-turn-helix transcriptional regulator [Colwellia sp.]
MNNKIKVLRAEQDWSQQKLADKIGVSRQAINAIERGKHDPSLQLAFDIANLFDQRIEEVFFPED